MRGFLIYFIEKIPCVGKLTGASAAFECRRIFMGVCRKVMDMKVKKEKKITEPDYRKWPVWDNYRYVFSWIRRQEGMGIFGICMIDVILQVAVPFLGMALPSAVCAFLTSQNSPGVILALVCSYVLAFQLLSLAKCRFTLRRTGRLFLFRISCDRDFFGKCLEMDDQLLESATGQRKMKAACRTIYSGNTVGIEAFVNNLLSACINFCGMAVYAVLIGKNSLWMLTGLCLLTALTALVNMREGKKGAAIGAKSWETYSDFHYLATQSVMPANGKDIRLYRMRKWFGRAFARMTGRAVEQKNQEHTCYLRAGLAENALALLRDGIIYVYLIAEMVQGKIGLSRFLLYAGIVAGFGNWMKGLVEAMREMQKNNDLMNQYRDFMESGVMEADGKAAVSSPGCAHEIRLEHVCFRYEGQTQDALHDLNLTIRAGEKLALVGANGAGKTTLVKLISGLYRPASGRIYLDGQDSADISREAYFREFSVVFQDVFAFSFSLEDNVTCKETERTDHSKLEECLKKADLWEKVQSLARKEKTVMNKDLDEHGVTLSGGELQKLMLARALYKEAAVVILDEPTAALDPLAESAMYEKYHELTKEKTSVFISHRLSSTRFCDRIIFMDNGAIVEAGTHDELMAKGGAYARMFETQAQYYRKKEEGCYA